MRVLIIADMEGVAGLAHRDACRQSSPMYAAGVELFAEEVNVLAGTAFDAGATAVNVIDWHGGGGNLTPQLLDARVVLAKEDLSPGYDVAVLSGFHAMHGDPEGFISHTMYGGLSVEVDREPVGELWLLSRWTGMYDVPVAFVSGDLAAVNEATRHLPGTPAVAVKCAVSFEEADVLAPEEARRRLADGLGDALRRRQGWRIYRQTKPFRYRLGLDWDSEIPRQSDLRRERDGRLSGEAKDAEELIGMIDLVASTRP